MLRLPATILFATVATLSLSACNDIAGNGNADAVVGVYTLQTVDGQPLPVVVSQQGEDTGEITQGTIALGSDGGFEDATLLRLTQSGVVTTETDAATGVWGLAGSDVQFNPDDGSGPYDMTWDGGDRLTQNFNGFILVYHR